MNILPMINLLEGACVHVSGVRLDQAQVFSEDPVDLVGRWMDRGAQDVYLFDVEGAIRGEPVHQALITSIAQRFPNMSLHVEGGLRSEQDIERYLKAGIKSVTLGTLAVEDPATVAEIAKRFAGRVRAALTLQNGEVMICGGQKSSSIPASLWAKQLSDAEIPALVYRDGLRLGTKEGVNIDEALTLAEVSRVPLWISGGVADMDDIRALYSETDAGIGGVLVSRALDEKTFSLQEAEDYCTD